ncbi:uncharacterized protein V1518DRAFT_110212 [Limtongia smithiae]|uniref:uncharacterized protein n=1 Tax=Limtongia smithiae TaxID=1125753 RepID=UPI0034CD7B1C
MAAATTPTDFEDNNPFAGADDLATDQLQSTDHFAAAVDGSSSTDPGDKSQRSMVDGFPSFRDSYDTSSHVDSDSAEPVAGKSSYSSQIEQMLTENPNLEILIIGAGKNQEGSGGGYIMYAVKTGALVVRRRYSEFESLRSALTRLFPTLIVPPIPEKHTMSDYAAKPTKAREDLKIIEHRQRMLAVFLNRCRAMRQIRSHQVFQKFLDPNVSWIEVLNSAPLTLIPKYVLRAPPLNTAAPTPGHAYLPVPPASARLREGDGIEFQAAEAHAKEYEIVLSGGIDRVNKRILRKYGDIAAALAEYGARLNAWSLNESNSLAAAIEKVGQAVDSTYIATECLIQSLSESFSEPLGESAQFASVVKAVLKYRHQKALQYEMTLSSLNTKKDVLFGLERTEMESQRINDYLLHRDNDGGANGMQGTADASINPSDIENSQPTYEYAGATEEDAVPKTMENGDDGQSTATIRSSVNDDELFPPTHAESSSMTAPSKPTRRSNGFKFPGIGKLSDAIHGIVDVDPEATRRNNIGKTREEIAIFETALQVADSDLRQASESVKADLARYQKTKSQDLRKIMIAYAKCHIEWARKNLEAWEEAKAHVDKITVK